ncbi:MAG: BspA family leucine-rich repeat surface protein, partial [Erysipelotrichaceae bacterium]|nr:BspA family leucine-rich repeat surface protein [Erysipelotrichaceae bacterium]
VQSKEESDSEKKDGTASSQETNPAEPNPALVKADENQTAENKQQNDDQKSQKAASFAVPADAAASGINGVKWYIDTAGALNFEAGELTSVGNWESYADKIREVKILSSEKFDKLILPENSSELFWGLSEVKSIETAKMDTSRVTSMNSMFFGCSKLTSLDLSGFQTGNVTDMGSMFECCTRLTSLNLSGFDTGKTVNMRSLFSGCTSLESVNLSGLDTSKVKDMSSMFYFCSSLASLDLSGFDTGNVQSMDWMFAYCSSLKTLGLSGFDTGSVTNMSYMFASCSGLKDLNLTSFDTAMVKNMPNMFANCSNLSALDLSSFDTGSVIKGWNMFNGCSSLQKINLSKDYFKGKAADSIPYSPETKWMQLVKPENVKPWAEMKKTWTEADAGWWVLQEGNAILTFQTNGGSEISPAAAECGALIDLAQYVPAKKGFVFTGWYTDAGCTAKAAEPFALNRNTVLYAGWAAEERTLSFDTNGALKMDPVNAEYGSTIDLKKYAPVREGHTFTGWFLDKDCQEKAGDSITLDADLTLYAEWEIQDRTVSFNTNGGLEVTPLTASYGTTVDLSRLVPFRSGYTFTGWFTDAECTVKSESSFVLKEDLTLYAGWKKDTDENNSFSSADNSSSSAGSSSSSTSNKTSSSSSAKTSSTTAASKTPSKTSTPATGVASGGLFFGLASGFSAMLAAAFKLMSGKAND